jgi:hypothetical protein
VDNVLVQQASERLHEILILERLGLHADLLLAEDLEGRQLGNAEEVAGDDQPLPEIRRKDRDLLVPGLQRRVDRDASSVAALPPGWPRQMIFRRSPSTGRVRRLALTSAEISPIFAARALLRPTSMPFPPSANGA